jgi:DNA repair protein SbcC/Rad50
VDIHRLTMANIGPFVGETDIDFGGLTRAGLFLLEGPTGSGKSTILDAIVFALYGSVATSSGGVERMRSDSADSTDKSYVELVFEVDAGIFRIQRTPTYVRAKKSGNGTTQQKSEVALWRLSEPQDPAGELLSTRSHEADIEVYRLIGLTKAQFVQTVLLPQGEFAAFLRASPLERQALLQRLFGTELYEAIERQFEDRRRKAERERRSAQQDLDHAITAFTTAAECDEPEAARIKSAVADELPGIVATILTTKEAAVSTARSVLTTTEEGAAKARAELELAQSHNQRLARLVSLKEREAAVLAGSDEQQRRKVRRVRLSAV